MAHTDKDEDVAEAIRALLEANKDDLELNDVLYGNHIMIPRASAAIVMPLGRRRQLAGVAGPGGRTLNQLIVGVDVHWSKVGDEETERKNADNRGSNVEAMLHSDTTLGGIVIHGFVTQVDRGESQFANNSMFRSVRMVYEAQTKTYLSQ